MKTFLIFLSSGALWMHCDVLQNAVEAIECIMTSITRSYECIFESESNCIQNYVKRVNDFDALDVVMNAIGRRLRMKTTRLT